MRTATSPHRRAGWVVAPVVVLALGLATWGTPAQAGGGRGTAHPAVTVTTFVQRDAHGFVVSRGATATLAGHPALRPISSRASRSRVATAHRGRPVVVRHVGLGATARTVAVARR